MSLARKRKKPSNATKASNSKSDSDSDWANNKSGAPASKKKRQKKASRDSSSSEENWDDDSQDEATVPAPVEKPADVQQNKPDVQSEQEEGEVSDSDSDNDKSKSKSTSSSGSGSDSSSSSSSSSDSEFDDGYDDDLMGDEEDRKRLNGLSEKERETEIFKRIEQRDIMRTRWEIERKLKLARRGEKNEKSKTKEDRAKKKSKKEKRNKRAKELAAPIPPPSMVDLDAGKPSATDIRTLAKSPSPIVTNREGPSTSGVGSASSGLGSSGEKSGDEQGASGVSDYFDHKERSKERKKNVEANKTDDKRSNAMAMLKAKREGKAKRGK